MSAARFLILAVLSGLLTGCSPLRGYEALVVLGDLQAGEAPSRLKSTTPPPVRTALSWQVAGHAYTGDLYLPGTGAPQAGVVLVPGAAPDGKDDPLLVAFARTLARAGFAVLVPEMPGFRELRIEPADTRRVADAFVYLAGRPDLSPGGRAGLIAFSYAVGPTLIAALEDDLRVRVRFVFGVGGYHDLPRTLRFMTTGWFEEDGQWRHIQPGDYARLVFVHSSLALLREPRDQKILAAMAALRQRDRGADLAPLAAGLGAEGRTVYDFLTHTDPARTPALLRALPADIQAGIAALSPAEMDLRRLQARLILVHGRGDHLIPYTESMALAQAVPPDQARLFLIWHLLGHVDLSPTQVFTWRFWRRDLPDVWRMGRAVDALLQERTARE